MASSTTSQNTPHTWKVISSPDDGRARRPPASSPEIRRRMQRQAQRDTGPELALRRAAWRLGLRYRVDVAPVKGLRRRADLVFTKPRVAVYVDGCFWHSCPDHGTVPKSNRAWWVTKLEANARRDRDTDVRLAEAAWGVVRVWEHDNVDTAAQRVLAAVRARS